MWNLISDSKIEYLFDLLNKNQSLAQAARTVGISYKTAMKYRDADRLPSEMRFSGSTKQTRLEIKASLLSIIKVNET